MNTPKQTPLVDILRLHAEDLHNDYGHNKSARLLSQAADEIERLRSSALALEDEKNDYMDGVGDVLRQDHDGETLWAAAQRVMSERDRLRTDNTGLLTVLDRMLTTLRYLIGIAERGEGHPIGGIEMQNILMKFDPATGEERPYPSHAEQWREWHGGTAWLFDPWTGRRRDARDVGSDVHGLLIVPAGTLGMDMGGGCSEKDNVACA